MSISDPVVALPREISYEIFHWFDIRDLAICCKVSKLWNQIANCNVLWASLAQLYLGMKLSPGNSFSIKKMLSEVLCLSNDQIVDRLKGFLNRCSLEMNCRFRCVLGLGKGYTQITVEIKRCDIDPGITIKEDYVAAKSLGAGTLKQEVPTASIEQLDADGQLKTYYPQPHMYVVNEHSEPDYTTRPPQKTQYREFIWRGKGGYSLKASVPHPGDLSIVTPLETKIDHMLAKKSDQYMEKNK